MSSGVLKDRRVIPGSVLALGLWVMVAVALALVDGLVRVPEWARLVAASVGLFVIGIIFSVLIDLSAPLRQRLVRLHLGSWICVGFSVVFGLSTLVWLTPATGTRAVTEPAFLMPAGLLAFLGLVCFLLGYRSTPGAVSRAVDNVEGALRGPPAPAPGVAAVLALWGVSMLSQIFSVLSGSFAYLSDPSAALGTTSSLPALVALLAKLGLLGTVLAAWRYAGSRNFAGLSILVIVVVTQIALGLFGGQKEAVLVQFLAMFVGYGVRRRVRFLPVLVLASLIVVLLVPFVTQYRTAVLTGSGRLTPAEVLATVSVEDIAASSRQSSVSDSIEQFGQRLSRVGDLAVIVQKTPSVVPFESSTDLLAGPLLGLVPRSIWADKPVLDAGYRMSSTYYGLPPNVFTASAMTPYGDLWRHGGLWVLAVGMGVLGWLVRAVDDRSGDSVADPRLLFLPMLLFSPLVKQETDYLGFLASLVGLLVVATLAARVVTTMSGGPVREPAPAGAVPGHS